LVDQEARLFFQLPCLVPPQIPYSRTGDHYHHSRGSKGPTCNPPQAYGRYKLRTLLSDLRGLCLLAGLDKGALRVAYLGGGCVAGGHPFLRRVDIVSAYEQRFGTSSPVPARRDFSKPRVLSNPIEVLPQRVS